MTSSHTNEKPTKGNSAKHAVLVKQTFPVSRTPEVVFWLAITGTCAVTSRLAEGSVQCHDRA
jgi:hypothetical protein